MILGFYNQDFANENGAITREIMQTSGYKAAFPGTTFQKGSKSKDNLITTRGGRMAFIGRGGSGPGKPADLVIIDDPRKNGQEADWRTTRRARDRKNVGEGKRVSVTVDYGVGRLI